jgi:hypothetical protein
MKPFFSRDLTRLKHGGADKSTFSARSTFVILHPSEEVKEFLYQYYLNYLVSYKLCYTLSYNHARLLQG